MIEINTPEFAAVIPLFRNIEHSVAIVHAVLEGNSPGRVFVDRFPAPASAFLFPEGTFFYLHGDETNTTFSQAVIWLIFDELLPNALEKEMVLFAFTTAWRERLDDLLREKGAILIQRKVFDFNPQSFADYLRRQPPLPYGLKIQPIDDTLAESFPVYRPLIEPRSKRFGFCLLKDGEIASECSSIFVGAGEAEIDVYTAEPYRGRGFAQWVASAFILACLEKGLRPNWACWPERQASVALARKLGFEDKTAVPAHLWVEEME